MTTWSRRYWLVAALMAALVAVLAFNWAVDRAGRERPNYSQIESGLYLGGRVSSPPPGTEAVLNVCETEDSYRVGVSQWEPIRDGAPAPSLDWLRKRVEFVAAQRRAGITVFIHCDAGISRSAMVAAAYLMERDGVSRDDALRLLRTRREVVRPNQAFMELLAEWKRTLKGSTTRERAG
jgi:hypothetical protein